MREEVAGMPRMDDEVGFGDRPAGRRANRIEFVVFEMDDLLVAFPFTDEEGLCAPSASVRQIGQGPDTARQERSHAHSVVEISDNVFVVADLGCDTLTSYRSEGDQLLRLSQTQCEPGAGPRHTALHPNGRFLYVLNELNSTCSSFAVDARSGALTPISLTKALSGTHGNHCSDIQISPDGRFLYGGNRGPDSISVFKTLDNGEVELLSSIPCGGETPRNLAFTIWSSSVLRQSRLRPDFSVRTRC